MKNRSYRIVHISGELPETGTRLEDRICIIENDDGEDIDDLDGEDFFWRFDDDEEFESFLRREGGESSKELLISSYFEYDERLHKRWWSWDDHSWKKVRKCRVYYRTIRGVLASKLGGPSSPPHFQSICNDGSVYVNWGVDGPKPPQGRTQTIRTDLIEDLSYEGDFVRCDCPFCGQTERAALEERVVFSCSNCRKRWVIRALL